MESHSPLTLGKILIHIRTHPHSYFADNFMPTLSILRDIGPTPLHLSTPHFGTCSYPHSIHPHSHPHSFTQSILRYILIPSPLDPLLCAPLPQPPELLGDFLEHCLILMQFPSLPRCQFRRTLVMHNQLVLVVSRGLLYASGRN